MEKHEHKHEHDSECGPECNHEHEEAENNSQEMMMKASLIQKQAEEIENNLEYIERQISELSSLSSDLEFLDKSENKEMIASIGKGVFAKANLADKKLFVEVGSGILVKKTPEETRKVIESQMKKFSEIRIQLKGQQELYNHILKEAISEIESKRIS